MFSKKLSVYLCLPGLLIASLACNMLGIGSSPQTYPEEVTIEQNITFGPGDLVFVDTQAGLADLSGYQATLTLSFDGTRDGNSEVVSWKYLMLASNSPDRRVWTIEVQTNGSSETGFAAEMDGMNYEKNGEDACTGNTIPADNSLRERLELASFLSGVIGAEEAGSDTVNGISAIHYTFDQRALGEDELNESTGELWVASEGGYIVRYLLTTKGGEDYFGEGVEGTFTVDYQVTEVNMPQDLTLPVDCPAGLVDAPVMADAENVSNVGGILSYVTFSSVEDATAFYQEQLPLLGWTVQGDASVTANSTFIDYSMGDRTMTVIISAAESKTDVHIVVTQPAETPTP